MIELIKDGLVFVWNEKGKTINIFDKHNYNKDSTPFNCISFGDFRSRETPKHEEFIEAINNYIKDHVTLLEDDN